MTGRQAATGGTGSRLDRREQPAGVIGLTQTQTQTKTQAQAQAQAQARAWARARARAQGSAPDPGPAAAPAWGLATVFVIAAAGLPLAVFVATGTRSGLPPGLVLTSTAVLALSVLRLAHLIGTGSVRIVTSVLWMFIYISGAVVPLAQASTGLYPSTMNLGYVLDAQVMILVFGLSLTAGQFWGARRPVTDRTAAGFRAGRVADRRVTVLTVVGSLVTVYYIARLGGPQPFFASRWAVGASVEAAGLRSSTSQVGSALLGTLATIPVLVCLIVWTIRLRCRPELRVFGNYALWAWLALLNTIVNNPISNARYWFLTAMVGFLFAMPDFGVRQFRRAVLVGIVAALVVFPYTDYYRTGAASGGVKVESIGTKISTKDYDQSTMTANGVWWVAAEGHTGGQQLLGSVLFWVPRSVWPDKPLDTGVAIGRAMDGPTANLSSPLWLELWVDFGLAGVVVGGGLIGAAARRVDDFFAELRHDRSAGISVLNLLLPLLAGYTFILMRGPLLQSMSRLSMILAVCLFLREPDPPRADPPEPEPAAGSLIEPS